MISPTFYIKSNTAKNFISSKLYHYPRKKPTLSLEYSFHEVQSGETLYTIAQYYFGLYGERYWTTIADLNGCIMPDWIEVGQKIKIPNRIIDERIDFKIVYERNISTSIKI